MAKKAHAQAKLHILVPRDEHHPPMRVNGVLDPCVLMALIYWGGVSFPPSPGEGSLFCATDRLAEECLTWRHVNLWERNQPNLRMPLCLHATP